MTNKLQELLEKRPEQVQALLNILLESAYFYRSDNEDLFLFLRRCQEEFREFFREFFGWELIIDVKCARVYKGKWYNDAITPANRQQFRLGTRDDCIAFMLLIEFFEKFGPEFSKIPIAPRMNDSVSDFPVDLAERVLPYNLIIFDGECVLCSSFYRFVLRWDQKQKLCKQV